MSLRKKLSVILLACAMVCFSLASVVFAAAAGSGVKVEDFFTATGLTLTENVAGNTLKDSGGTVLFANEDKTGIQVSGNKGGTLKIDKQLRGAFEIDFRVWSDTIGSGTTAVPQLSEFSIMLDDGENSFTVHLNAADTNVTHAPAARVSINGGADQYAYAYNNDAINSYRCNSYGTALLGTTMANQETIRFLPWNNGSYADSVSTRIGFDPSTMEVYTYFYNISTHESVKKTIWALDETKSFSGPAPTEEVRTLASFGDAYSVTLSFDGVAEGKTGQMVIYSVNGTSLATTDGEFGAAVPTIIGMPTIGTSLMAGDKFEIPAPQAYDLFNGEAEFAGTVTAELDGSPATIEGLNNGAYQKGCYLVLKSGKYTLTYTPKQGDLSGESKSVSFTVVSDADYSDKTLADLFGEGLTLSERSVKGTELQDGSGTVLFPNEDKDGVKLTSSTGGEFAFVNRLAGTFEIDFRVWADTTMKNDDGFKNFADVDGYNTREVAITISDGVNQFTIHVTGGDIGHAAFPAAYVSYGDGTDRYAMQYSDANGAFASYRVNGYGTWLIGSSFVNMARGFGAWLTPDKTISTRIGFDPETMEVYAYAYKPGNTETQKYVVWKLDEKATSFAGVDDPNAEVAKQPTIESFGSNYTVSISMTAQSGKTAQMVVYSVNGQSFKTNYAGQIYNDAAPIAAGSVVTELALLNEKYELPAYTFYDVLDGAISSFTVSVKGPDEKNVALEGAGANNAWQAGCGFTPTAEGSYTVTYTAADAQGKTAQYSYTVAAGEPIPEFVSFPEYEEELVEADRFVLPVPTLKDILNGEYDFMGTVTATLDGEPVAIEGITEDEFAKGCYIVVQPGKYEITYTPSRDGYEGEEKVITITVSENPSISDVKYTDILQADGVTMSEKSVSGTELKDSTGKVLFPNEDKDGVKLTSETGGEVAFVNRLAGTFEIDFRVWADTTMSNDDGFKNFADMSGYNAREVAITISDGVNEFTIHIAGGDIGHAAFPAAYVSYGNGADRYAMKYSDSTGAFENYRMNGYGTWLIGSSFVNMARNGVWVTSDKTISTRIGFDPATMEVYAYAYKPGTETEQKYVIWKLNEKATSFAGIEDSDAAVANQPTIESFGSNYTVSISMTAQSGKTAQMVVYSVNGQKLQADHDGYIVNTAGPCAAQTPLVLPGETGKFYELPNVQYSDVLDGALSAVPTVMGPDGKAVELEQDGKGFTPAAKGEYTVTYAIKDAQGIAADAMTITITVSDAATYPEPGEGDIPEGTEPPDAPGSEIKEPESQIPEDEPPAGGCSGSVYGWAIGGSAVLLGAAVALICVLRKKKAN